MMGKSLTLWTVLSLVTSFSVLPARAQTWPDKALPHIIEQRVQGQPFPALSVAIIRGDKGIFLQALGHYDLAKTRPLKPDAQFQVGSITKGLVGTLAGILASQGELDLGKPALQTLAMIPAQQSANKAKITLLHLLTHHAGLNSNPPNRRNIPIPSGLPDGVDPTIWAPYSMEELRAGFSQAKLHSLPGTRDYYSNFGFHLAASVIAKEQGAPTIGPVLHDRLFEPLGMTKTDVSAPMSTHISPQPLMYGADPEISGYDPADNRFYPLPYWRFGEAVGGIGVSSTAGDLAKLILAFFHGIDGKGPLPADAMKTIFTSRHSFIRGQETVYRRALGWRMSVFGDHGPFYRHNGHNDGHHGFVAFSLEKKLGIVLLTNGSHQHMERFGNSLLLTLLERSPTP